MEIELVEIRDFLAQRPPFDELPDERLDTLPRMLEIRYLRRGGEFPPVDTKKSYLYVVRSGIIDLLDDDDNLVEKLDEGDVYTTACQLVDIGKASHGIAVEDTLLYQLPCEQLNDLRRTDKEFDRHFSESLRERLKMAVSTVKEVSENGMAYMTIEVGDLLTKPAVTVDADSTIQQAAQAMTEKNASSVILTEHGKLVGMITDRDLRRRCVAEGTPTGEPAHTIMASNLETIDLNALVIQALMTMTRLHVHHLPVLDGDKVVGMLSATDLARHQATNSAFMATDIHKAHNLEELVQASSRLPELQLQLANSSASAQHIGEAVSCITDSLTARLIAMAEEELGPPPVPYVWLCGGSQARREQSSHSDQDNALLISNEMRPEHEAWFATLAKRVCDGLNACGFIYCPGNAMAANRKWRQPLRVWRRYFRNWIEKPEPMALMLSSIFFDLRPVRGEKTLFEQLHREVLNKTRSNGIFIAYMAANALQFRPPLGFFRTFVLIHDGDHDDTFDIKHRGIVPITDIARLLALSKGLAPVNTTERLQAVGETNALSREMGGNLVDALEFIATLRIHHQAEQIRLGLPPDNYLPPDDLSELERKHLKDAFRVIQEMQDTLDSRYQCGRLR
jgi:CBS domain-containing protein